MLLVAATKAEAIKSAKQTAFYKHTTLPGNAVSHIDDKYGVDVDDVYEIKDILPNDIKSQFSINISETPGDSLKEDHLHLGYLKWPIF